MLDEVTTPPREDVTVDKEIETPEVEVEDQQVEETSTGVPETTTDDYDKAWEKIDLDNPSDDLFSETTAEPKETPTVDQVEEEEVQDVKQEGLTITNPVLKYKGRDIPIENEEEALKLMQKGFKLESEMTKIKPYKQMINIVEEQGVSIEDLKSFADALGGNEGAKKYVQNKLGLKSTSEANGSFFDEVEETPAETVDDYKPEIPKQDGVAEYFATITENSPEIAGKVSQVYADIDNEFKQEVYTPQIFPMFVKSVASGEFDEVYPLAIKARLSNPGLSWMEAYQMAGSRVAQGKTETKATVPPKGTEIPSQGSSRDLPVGEDYDRAFNMDTKELEDRLFG